MQELTFIIHAATTFMMTGIIWFVKVVHYPLFHKVGQDNFSEYETHHTRLTGWVVGPLMIAELLTAALLFFWGPPDVPFSLLLAGVVLLTVIWGSTALLQVPLHGKLILGFDVDVIQKLVNSNWIRTIAWSLRALLIIIMMFIIDDGR